MIDDLYHQEILEHYKDPHNFGEIDNPDITTGDTNASCGDSFTFYIKLAPNSALSGSDPKRQRRSSPGVGGIIEEITFTGQGCAISTASSSMLTNHLKGKPISELSNLNQDFMQRLIGTEITPTRIKCLMLPAKAIQKSKR